MFMMLIFFFKQKTAYEMRISDWSSDVCSSDLLAGRAMAVGIAVAGDGVDRLGRGQDQLGAEGHAPETIERTGSDEAVRGHRIGLDERIVIDGGLENGRASGRESVWQYG